MMFKSRKRLLAKLGLDWIGLDWTGSYQTRLDWIGLDWIDKLGLD